MLPSGNINSLPIWAMRRSAIVLCPLPQRGALGVAASTHKPHPADPIIPWRLRDHLQLQSVLVPLTGHYRRQHEIPARALQIRQGWRATVERLRQQGWDPLLDLNRHRSACGCPMTFVMVRGKPRSCKLRTACPFCWARQAAQWWDVVDRAFFLDGHEAQRPRPAQRPGRMIELDDAPPRRMRAVGYQLVTRRRAVAVPPYIIHEGQRIDMLRDFYTARLSGQPQLLTMLGEWFARAPEIKAGMRAIARDDRRSGCFENITAQIMRNKRGWWVAVRQVWLVPGGAVLPVNIEVEGMTFDQRVFDNPWRSQVMRAMAQACRYPAAMLLEHRAGGPAHQLTAARHGLRLAATYGAFRGSQG